MIEKYFALNFYIKQKKIKVEIIVINKKTIKYNKLLNIQKLRRFNKN